MLKKYYCDQCDKLHVEVVFIAQEEADSLRFLDGRIKTANDILQSGNINDNVIKAAMELISDSQFNAGKWWDEISAKYNLDMGVNEHFVDFNRKTVYYLTDKKIEEIV